MIEMLGVLAIIGVLSGGGIWAYSVAMENYKTNKLISDLETMRAAALSVFPKRARTGVSTVPSPIPNLHAVGIIPEDWWKTRSGNCALGSNACKIKDPFGSDISIDVVERTGGYNATNYNGYRLKSASNAVLYVFYLRLPKRACVKFFTYDWKSSYGASMLAFTSGGITPPISVAEADAICPSLANKVFGFDLFFKGEEDPNWRTPQ